MARTKIIWTPKATDDLREIRERIARNAPKTAQDFTRWLTAAAGRLKDFPEIGWIVEEIGDPRIREIGYGNFRIIYRFTGKRIYILAVRRGSRLLDPEEFVE